MKHQIGANEYDFDVPFGLGVLEDAGDEIDAFVEMSQAIAATDKVTTKMLMGATRVAVACLHAAINLKTPGKVTIEQIMAGIAYEDCPGIINLMNRSLSRSGFEAAKAGESRAVAPAAPKASSRSPSKPSARSRA